MTAPTVFTTGGQFDTCIAGNGAASGGVVTGWNVNLGTSSWTISMWLQIPSTSSGSAYYIFGDGAQSFRCFHNGVAGQDNIVLRGTGVTDVNVTGVGPGPTVVHFVYDSAASNIKAYKNGVLANTVTQAPLNLSTGNGFKVGGCHRWGNFQIGTRQRRGHAEKKKQYRWTEKVLQNVVFGHTTSLVGAKFSPTLLHGAVDVNISVR